MTARVRGLDFAVWTSPPVAGAPPLLLVNGGMLYDHSLLWPALSPLAVGPAGDPLRPARSRRRRRRRPIRSTARIEDDADDIGALRRALGIRRWDVLGHSWGGGIAMLGVARDLAGTRAARDGGFGRSDERAGCRPCTRPRSLASATTSARRSSGWAVAPQHEPDPAMHGALQPRELLRVVRRSGDGGALRSTARRQCDGRRNRGTSAARGV